MSSFDHRTPNQEGPPQRARTSFRGSTMRTTLVALASAGALALIAPGSALAAPVPEGPSNCTFAKGKTICAYTTFEDSSSTSEPDADGCVTTTTESAEFTTYTAHRGSYNSAGKTVEAPPPTAISATTISVDCPGD